MLLDESNEPECDHIDQERLTQVWFAGVHSNVGGGYPDDSLAHVPLLWMAERRARRDCVFTEHLLNEWVARADPNGPLVDSRGGLGSYYRYNPRSIQKLTDDRFADVRVPRPKIHESVFPRISVGRDGYAPIVLPDALRRGAPWRRDRRRRRRVRASDAAQARVAPIRSGSGTSSGGAASSTSRPSVLTSLLFARPFVIDPDAGGVLAIPSNGLSAAIGLLANLHSGRRRAVGRVLSAPAGAAGILSALIAALLFASGRLQQSIGEHMRALWDATVTSPATPVTPSRPPDDWVFRLRSHHLYRNVFEALLRKCFRFCSDSAAWPRCRSCLAGTLNRGLFAAAGAAGQICKGRGAPGAGRPRDTFPSHQRTVHVDRTAAAGGPALPGGNRAARQRPRQPERALDGRDDAREHAGGIQQRTKPDVLALLPFRRVLTARWFVPIVRVGNQLAEYHRIEHLEEITSTAANGTLGVAQKRRVRGFVEFTPTFTGPMFLFVNDAIAPWSVAEDAVRRQPRHRDRNGASHRAGSCRGGAGAAAITRTGRQREMTLCVQVRGLTKNCSCRLCSARIVYPPRGNEWHAHHA